MTDPLLDRDALIDYIDGALHIRIPTATGDDSAAVADTVLSYLRDVLTSEALDPREMEGEGFVRRTHWADGTDLHRRIFGEDT